MTVPVELEKFIAREVQVEVQTIDRNEYHPEKYSVDHPERYIKYMKVDYEDVVVKEILAAHKLVRFWLPHTIGTMDWHPNRLNVTIQELDSKFVITSMNMG